MAGLSFPLTRRGFLGGGLALAASGHLVFPAQANASDRPLILWADLNAEASTSAALAALIARFDRAYPERRTERMLIITDGSTPVAMMRSHVVMPPGAVARLPPERLASLITGKTAREIVAFPSFTGTTRLDAPWFERLGRLIAQPHVPRLALVATRMQPPPNAETEPEALDALRSELEGHPAAPHLAVLS